MLFTSLIQGLFLRFGYTGIYKNRPTIIRKKDRHRAVAFYIGFFERDGFAAQLNSVTRGVSESVKALGIRNSDSERVARIVFFYIDSNLTLCKEANRFARKRDRTATAEGLGFSFQDAIAREHRGAFFAFSDLIGVFVHPKK